jgi:hypothetical protein
MKKLAIGCGIVAVLCALIIAGLIVAWPKISGTAAGWFQEKMKEQENQAKFEAAWKPPTPQPSEQWFPNEVADWKRTTYAPFHEVPELSSTEAAGTAAPPTGPANPPTQEHPLMKDGFGATYALNGQEIEVKAIPATELEREGLMARAHMFKPAPASGGPRSFFRRGNVLELKYGARERIYCRLLGDWFVFLHTLDGAELKPFAEAWLRAIDTQPAAATPTPEAPR